MPKLKALGHEVAIFAFYGLQGAKIEWEGITVYPPFGESWGNDVVEAHARHFEADIVSSLVDAWVLTHPSFGRIGWCPWAPIDHDPIPNAVAESLRKALVPIAFSKFGYEQMRSAGLEPLYVPHAIPKGVFYPKDRQEARRRLKTAKRGVNDDTFIAVMVAANKGYPPRKSFHQVIPAWADFCKDHPNSVLYLHTEATQVMGGIDILSLCAFFDVSPDNVMLCDPYYYRMGFPLEYMNDIYNAADVLLSPSMGEGFGLPIVEAQLAGCPVITTNATAMPELTFAGWKVEAMPMYMPQGSLQALPGKASIREALEQAFEARGDEALRARARAGAVEYDLDLVMEKYWAPALRVIARLRGVPYLAEGEGPS